MPILPSSWKTVPLWAVALPRKRSNAGLVGSINYFTQLVLDQAKAMYRYWPEVGERLFDEA